MDLFRVIRRIYLRGRVIERICVKSVVKVYQKGTAPGPKSCHDTSSESQRDLHLYIHQNRSQPVLQKFIDMGFHFQKSLLPNSVSRICSSCTIPRLFWLKRWVQEWSHRTMRDYILAGVLVYHHSTFIREVWRIEVW